MIDFDLESPGLTLFNRKIIEHHFRAETGANSRGLMDIIHRFIEEPEKWGWKEKYHTQNLEFITSCIVDLPIPENTKTEGLEGRLALLPAGNVAEDLEKSLERIKWNEEPLCTHRDTFFHYIKDIITRANLFDYVFIDSRTGFSNDAYIASRAFADQIVVLCGLNDQNIIGTARFLRHVASWRVDHDMEGQQPSDQNKKVILVASPVPEWEETEKSKRIKEVKALFKEEGGKDVEFSLSLPYHPILALKEEIVVSKWPESSLSLHYNRLVNYIRTISNDDAQFWMQEISYGIENLFSSNNKRDWAKQNAYILSCLKILEPISGEIFPATQFEIGRQLYQCAREDRFKGQYVRAETAYITALEIFKKMKNQRFWEAVTHHAIGLSYRLQYRLDEATAMLETALNVCQEIKHLHGVAAVFHELGLIELQNGRCKSAKNHLSKAMKIRRERDEKSEMEETELYLIAADAFLSSGEGKQAQHVSNLESKILTLKNAYLRIQGHILCGRLLFAGGDTAKALQLLDAGLANCEAFQFQGYEAEIRADLAIINEKIGNFNRAKEEAKQSLSFFNEQEVLFPKKDALDKIANKT